MRTTSTLLIALLTVVGSAQAFATPFKAWVSNSGTDSGTCQLPAPCKTLQYAHDQIAANGEIDVLDSGSYGTISINKAITLVAADGVLATIGVPQNGTGINVYAPSSKVLIRGFSIDGHSIPSTGYATSVGIRVSGADSVVIDHCLITHLDEAVSGYNGYIYIFSSNLSDNENAIDAGFGPIFLGGTIITNNFYGIQVGQGTVYSYGDNYINGNKQQDIRGTLSNAARR